MLLLARLACLPLLLLRLSRLLWLLLLLLLDNKVALILRLTEERLYLNRSL
jgi:hypothetical protein